MNKLDQLEMMLRQPRTVAEICEQMKVERTTVYRWFRKLEEHRGKTLVTFGFRQPRRYLLQ